VNYHDFSLASPAGRGTIPAPDTDLPEVWAREPAAELSRSAFRRWENTTVKRRRFLGLGVFFLLTAMLVGAGVWWFVHPRPVPYRLVMEGGRSSTGQIGISSGNVFLVSGKPAVCFGTVTKPGAKEELTYVLVFRRIPPGLSFGPEGPPIGDVSVGSSGEPRKHGSRVAFTINGKRIEASYEVELNETSSAVTREALTAGGQRKELAAGRVFLIDLDGASPAYKQKSLNQSPSVTPLQSPADVERLAEAILKALESQDEEARAFLE
jgi:hypothetical protein